jgi:mRNA interferase YafQ
MKQNTGFTRRMTVKEFLEAIRELDETVCQIQITGRFKKSLDLSYRRNLDLELLREIVHALAKGETLAPKYRAHLLEGYKATVWECHVRPDWLLLWQHTDDGLVLILLDTGTHSDLF